MLIARIIESFLFPPGIFIVLGLLGLWISRYFRWLGNLLIILTLSLIWLFSTPWFSFKLINSLQDQFPDLSTVPADADCIVVLSGGSTFSGEDYSLDPASYQRVQAAAELSKQTGLPVITTGGQLWGAPQSEAAMMAKVLEKDFSIRPVLIEEQSRTTWEHPVNLKPLLREHGYGKPVVVTHAWHMPRTMYSFRQHQLAMLPAPAHRSSPLLIEQQTMQYFPRARSLERVHLALHEWLGMLVYQFKTAGE